MLPITKNRFAFIVHPTSLENFCFILGSVSFLISKLSNYLSKEFLKKIPPFRFLYINKIKSMAGGEIDGIAVLCPLLPEHFVTLENDIVLKKIVSAGKLAQKLGAKIIGLAGFTSIFSNQGLDILGELEIPITTGNTYTASLVLDGVYKSVELLQYDLKQCTLAIIGATGDIGSICARTFANRIKEVILVARDQERLSKLEQLLHEENSSSTKITIMKEPHEAAQKANIIITSTSSVTTLLDTQYLKKGSIICDVSLPPNVARGIARTRNDILVFEGGYAKLPFFNDLNDSGLKKYFPHGAIYGCLAETILLTLEGKFENYTIGRGNISLNKINEIRNISHKHGFTLAPFFCEDKTYENEDFEIIKNHRAFQY